MAPKPDVVCRYVLFGLSRVTFFFFFFLRIEKTSCENSEFELPLTMEESSLHWLWAGRQALLCPSVHAGRVAVHMACLPPLPLAFVVSESLMSPQAQHLP